MTSKAASTSASVTKEEQARAREEAARLKRERHNTRGMSRVLTSNTETPFVNIQLTSTHPPEPLEEDFDLDEAKMSRKYTQREHLVSYELENPFSGIEVVSLDDPDDHELPEILTPLRDFSSCYRHLTNVGLSDNIHHTALYIDEGDNIRLFDIMGEQTISSQALSQLPKKEKDVGKGPKSKLKVEAAAKNTFKKSDILYRLPENLILTSVQSFKSTRDMLQSFKDSLLAHKALADSGEVHGNIDINTLLMSDHNQGKQQGFLYDYEPARSFSVLGMNDINWRAMLGGTPGMRDVLPELVKRMNLNKGAETAMGPGSSAS
ncbi:hypothetical protein NEOLEDRAFT_1140568 [Neolentinus lepideus HHB14362 ss-1]|uniref:Fungal-type protein kinase domain-containing protein n=1 Tax=Neolentinus lepideus HHB14362 ss-1 TaxID=1314782 RepID=A0A165P6I0_9AGAM|nr:hypothetical protein NEOLEDRAFT_1140568 [Neolentinus lepideus HHB14362 ss-1]